MAKYTANKRDAEYFTRVPVIKSRKIWFINGDLCRVEHIQRSEDIVTLYNFIQERNFIMTMVEFKRKRERAYSVLETAKLLNYERKTIPMLVSKGILPKPTGKTPGGVTKFHYSAYYAESQVYEARKLLAQTHPGRPRKDGRVTNNKVPTEQELRVAMGGAMLVYIQDKDGNFVPIFSETI